MMFFLPTLPTPNTECKATTTYSRKRERRAPWREGGRKGGREGGRKRRREGGKSRQPNKKDTQEQQYHVQKKEGQKMTEHSKSCHHFSHIHFTSFSFFYFCFSSV